MKWLDRELITGPNLILVTTEKEYLKAIAACGVPAHEAGRWISSDHANATVHFLEPADGDQCCIVAIQATEANTSIQIAGLLVHEAVHVFQRFCERIGEDDPSAEFEAYSIQTISQRLMLAYAETLEKP